MRVFIYYYRTTANYIQVNDNTNNYCSIVKKKKKMSAHVKITIYPIVQYVNILFVTRTGFYTRIASGLFGDSVNIIIYVTLKY